MNKGDKVVCHRAEGYNFTVGKTYKVTDYVGEWQDTDSPGGFTWPAYVEVVDDAGKLASAHASRFERVN